MRVLVTGGAGFLGSHVVDMLLAQGHTPIVLDDLSTGSRANLPPGFPLIEMDITGPLEPVFERGRPDVVLHLAAQVSVPHSMEDPARDAAVNVMGTINLMNAAAKSGCRKVVYLSSAAVYGIPEQLPLTETMTGQPLSPYGLSKRTAEEYIRLLGQLGGIRYTILRPANIYGPRQVTKGEGAVIPAFLGAFLAERDPVIQGDGSQTRDFIYVRDMARAVLAAMDRADGATLNVSSETAISIKELWQRLAALVGWRRPAVHGPAREGDIPHSLMANQRAKLLLQWEPATDFNRGLVETVEYALEERVAATTEASEPPNA